MSASQTYEVQRFTLISLQWNPLSRGYEAQLDWILCLASSLERIKEACWHDSIAPAGRSSGQGSRLF